MELVQLVRIPDEEIHHAALRIGRAFPQEHLHLTQVYTRERRRIAPGERQVEAEFFRIEVDSGNNVADGEASVGLLTFDDGSGRRAHGHLLGRGSSAPDQRRDFEPCSPISSRTS